MRPIGTSVVALILAASIIGCSEERSDSYPIAGPSNSGSDIAPENEPLLLDDEVMGQESLLMATGSNDAPFDPQCIVEPDSVAGIGMPATLGDFAASFPSDAALIYGRTAVEHAAMCVNNQGRRAICALFAPEDFEANPRTFAENYAFNPDIEVIGLSANAVQCQTEEGVGPETSIEIAESIYGDALFSFADDDIRREFVTFENGPAGLQFRAIADDNLPEDDGNPIGASAGDYSDAAPDATGRTETRGYRPGARILEIRVAAPGAQ